MDDKLEPLVELAMNAKVSVDELTIRVCQYEADAMTPASYQALAKFQNRARPWGVGIHADPVEAAKIALRKALELHSPAPPVAPPRIRTRKLT